MMQKESHIACGLRTCAPSTRAAGTPVCVTMQSARTPLVESLDRRSFLLATLFASAIPALAYDFREESVGGCGVLVPAVWKRLEGGDGVLFDDPVSGAVLSRLSVRTAAVATKSGSIKDLGKVESLNLEKALGVRPELAKADMVGAGKHGKGSSITYDYDLAIAPKTCSRADEVVSGSCAYTEVVLLSAFVDQEKLNVLEIVATAEQWKKNGPALRGVRDSFGRKRT
mmetsp:Transcript_4730/g.9071  ORF Transcript_4730/g.9071 Transcript_4730/m.9071 type:complete len:227 (-) Transcript_4730:241-921(-)